MTETDRVRAYLSGLLEEYRTLRDESKQASINMLLTLQIGAGAVAILLGAAVAQWPQTNGIAPLILLIVIPLVAAISFFMWLGEARRFKRVGDYICLIEHKYELAFVDPLETIVSNWEPAQRKFEEAFGFKQVDPMLGPLNWEKWLRLSRPELALNRTLLTGSGHDVLLYAVRVLFFPAMMLLSIALGCVQLNAVKTDVFGSFWVVIVALGLLIGGVSGLLGGMIIKELVRRPGQLPT